MASPSRSGAKASVRWCRPCASTPRTRICSHSKAPATSLSPLAPLIDWRSSTSESPSDASGVCWSRRAGTRSVERHDATAPSRPYATPLWWSSIAKESANRAGSPSASLAAIAAPSRAALSVAAFGRTRRRVAGGSAVSSSKRASASVSRSAPNSSQRVTRPSVPKTRSRSRLPLEGAAAGTVRAVARPTQEVCVGSQIEHIVDAVGDVVGNLIDGAQHAQHSIGSAHGFEAHGPVIGEFDGRPDRPGVASKVVRAHVRRDRARRRRGAGAFGSVGEELGVALVESGDGVAQLVGGEVLGPPASPLRVDLDQMDLLSLVCADIKRPADKPARRRRRAAQRERVAEGCERLVPGVGSRASQQGAPGGKQSLPVPCGAGGVIHGFRLVGEQGGERVGDLGPRSRRRSESACAVAAFGRTRRRMRGDLGGSAVSSSKRASASPSRSSSNCSQRVTRPSAPKTQS